MRKTIVTLMLACAGQLAAGGFFLQVGNPEANAEARKMGAVVVIKAVGCHDLARAKVTANAIGMVNGQRQSIALDVKALSAAWEFGLAQQWPKQGKWVIQVAGKNHGQFTNTPICLGPEGIDRLPAKFNMQAFPSADVDAMLQ